MADEELQTESGRDVTVVAVGAIASASGLGNVKATVTMPTEWMKVGFVRAVERFEVAAPETESAGNARDVSASPRGSYRGNRASPVVA